MALHTIEIFAGVGMLGEGVRAGLGYMGVETRCVCYVEREAHAAAVLAARIESGALDPAPVWSDVCTFDARRWRGAVDCIVAGFPCQDLSVAGRRAGLDGARSGLFFEVLRIADDSGAELIVLENVAGIASATASVVDEAEGDLDERAAARVVGELADRGWNAEWLTLSASDVGASHGRARWFCLAWRMADTARDERDGLENGPTGSGRGVCEAGHRMEHSYLPRRKAQRAQSNRPRKSDEIELRSGALGDTKSNGRREGRAELQGREGRPDSAGAGGAVADADGIGRRQEGYRELESIRADRGRLPIFAPGPNSPAWERIITSSPWLAPAIEPAFRELVDGVAFDMGDCRSARLRCVGNGVVPLQAAAAVVVLARRAGIFG